MPFFEERTNINKAKGEAGNSLQKNLNKQQTYPIQNPNIKRMKQKRVSFPTSKKVKASLAVEASIAMPTNEGYDMNSPPPVPSDPHVTRKLPALSNFWMRFPSNT